MQKCCVLFDADGVVIHSELFSEQYAKEFGISTQDMLPFFIGEFGNCLIGKADLKELLPPRLEKWKRKGTLDEFLTYRFQSEDHVDMNCLDLVAQLRKKGIICNIATNQEKYRTNYMKTNMQFSTHFDYIYSSSGIGYKKPQTAYYEFILQEIEKKYQLGAKDVFFFDDTQENVDQANLLGINAFLYQGVEHTRQIINKHMSL